MNQRILRAGVIGGGVGRAHARGYKASGGAQLTAICDIDGARAQTFGEEFGVPPEHRYIDYRQMLADSQLDVVSIGLPNYLHMEATLAALEAGVHVICEKPLATSVTQAEQMIAAAEKANRRLIVCYNFRFRSDTQWMHNVISSGQIGDIHHISATWRRETGIPGRGWFGRKEMSGGGALIDLGVHVLDLTLWFLGFPAVTTVSGSTRALFGPHGFKVMGGRFTQKIDAPFDVDDGAMGFMRFANGANAFLQATWAEHRQPQDDLIHMEVQGTRGTLVLNIPNYRNDDTLRLYTEVEGEPVTITPAVRTAGKLQAHEALISEAVSALLNDTPSPADGAQGLAAVRVLEALYQSAEHGREVALAPTPAH